MQDLFKRRILFVGGKGGVGKTTTAAALSLLAANHGRRCLLVSTNPAHSLGDIFGQTVGDKQKMLAPGLFGLEIDPDIQASRYMASIRRDMRSVAGLQSYADVDRQMDRIRFAPGAADVAMAERIAELMASSLGYYDLLAFDTAPIGHTLGLFSFAETLEAWAEEVSRHHTETFDREHGLTGPNRRRISKEILLSRRRKFDRFRRLLTDTAMTAFVLVLNPEKLPILESKKALKTLRRLQVPVAAMVVNRVLPEDATGDFMQARRKQEAEYLKQIETEFGALKRYCVPLLPHDVRGIDNLRDVARFLAD